MTYPCSSAWPMNGAWLAIYYSHCQVSPDLHTCNGNGAAFLTEHQGAYEAVHQWVGHSQERRPAISVNAKFQEAPRVPLPSDFFLTQVYGWLNMKNKRTDMPLNVNTMNMLCQHLPAWHGHGSVWLHDIVSIHSVLRRTDRQMDRWMDRQIEPCTHGHNSLKKRWI